MKKIEAIVRPHAVDDIRAALLEAGFHGMTHHGSQGRRQTERPYGSLSWSGVSG